jgi:phosphoserine phosphatase
MTSIVLIRHGETDWNVDGRYQGQADPSLNAKGIQQAHTLAKDIKRANMQLLYSSPLLRASQTADILANKLGLPLYFEQRLMEIHQGDWQTRLRGEIEALYPDLFKRWETQPWQVTPPGGESLDQVKARVDQVIDDLVRTHPGQKLGIVTHRIPIALVKMRFQNLDLDIVRTLHLPNTYWEEIMVPGA